jgi:hypothetical protein
MFPSTFGRLEVFLAVVEVGGFIAAAKQLGISYPLSATTLRRSSSTEVADVPT